MFYFFVIQYRRKKETKKNKSIFLLVIVDIMGFVSIYYYKAHKETTKYQTNNTTTEKQNRSNNSGVSTWSFKSPKQTSSKVIWERLQCLFIMSYTLHFRFRIEIHIGESCCMLQSVNLCYPQFTALLKHKSQNADLVIASYSFVVSWFQIILPWKLRIIIFTS